MRSKEQIRDQREFIRAVRAKIDASGFLYSFVAKNIGISSARFSQFIGNHRQMPPSVRQKLHTFLKL